MSPSAALSLHLREQLKILRSIVLTSLYNQYSPKSTYEPVQMNTALNSVTTIHLKIKSDKEVIQWLTSNTPNVEHLIVSRRFAPVPIVNKRVEK